MLIDHAREDQNKKDRINFISKYGGSSMLAKGQVSRHFSNSAARNIEFKENDPSCKITPTRLTKIKESKKIKLNLNYPENLSSSKEGFIKPSPNISVQKNNSSRFQPGAADLIKRNKSVDFKLDVSKLEYADKSIELDDEEREAKLRKKVFIL